MADGFKHYTYRTVGFLNDLDQSLHMYTKDEKEKKGIHSYCHNTTKTGHLTITPIKDLELKKIVDLSRRPALHVARYLQ